MKKTKIARLSVLAFALIGMFAVLASLHGCSDSKTQAALDTSAKQIQQAQVDNQKAQNDAQTALAQANAINDSLAAQAAQAKIDATAKAAKDLATAQTLHDAAQAAQDAKGQTWQNIAQTVTTIGGVLPPPFNLIGLVAGAVVTGGFLGNKKGLATGQTALNAQAVIASHAAMPGAAPADVVQHTSTVLSGLSDAAKALYAATPDIAIPVGATGGTPVQV